MSGSAVAVGAFDGVHLGHQEILRLLVQEGAERDAVPVALTFEPHPRPRAVSEEGGLLLSSDERNAVIRALGVQWVMALRFTPAVRAMGAEQFFREVLVAFLQARVVIVGPNHRFGRGGAGDADLLRRLGTSAGVDVVVVPECMVDEAPVSSRRIRSQLTMGLIEEARRSLGRPYRLDGTVVRGSGIGRELGFPTANLEPDKDRLVPADGVYGGIAHLEAGSFPAVVNVGYAPTFHRSREASRRIEVHLIDHHVALYGRRMGISLVVRVRDERQFSGVEDLRRQIAADVGRIRCLLGGRADQGLGITAGNHDPSPSR